MPNVNDLTQVTLLVTLLEEIIYECEYVPQTQEQLMDKILILRLITDTRVERGIYFCFSQVNTDSHPVNGKCTDKCC